MDFRTSDCEICISKGRHPDTKEICICHKPTGTKVKGITQKSHQAEVERLMASLKKVIEDLP